MFALALGVMVLTAASAQQPTAEQTRLVLSRLAQEADRFERNAHRFTGIETLRQVQPEGTRYSTGPRGITTKLPEAVHEIVSEYGYISSDEPGGSLKEVRLVLTVNGLKWKRGKKDLSDLANRIGSRDAKNRGRTLESYENYGLRGFLSDAGQIILLFSRGGVERFEFSFDRAESGAWVYKYRQIDGPQALTIYGGKQPIRQKLQGEYWARSSDATPLRVTLDSAHQSNEIDIRDLTMVDYEMSRWGLLLPTRIDHRQFTGNKLFVVDEFRYKEFKQVQPGKIR
jgi:hypothetical protein